jgi:hypothetical protein
MSQFMRFVLIILLIVIDISLSYGVYWLAGKGATALSLKGSWYPAFQYGLTFIGFMVAASISLLIVKRIPKSDLD